MTPRTPLLFLAMAGLPLLSSQAAEPTFNCAQVPAGSIEALICQTPSLGELDQRLAKVYQQASAKAVNEHPPLLKAEQRGWIKGRDDCWKAEDKPLCVSASYRQRIAELQARYALLTGKGPVFYSCDGVAAKEVVATFYPTDPASVVVEFGDSSSLMLQQVAASGSRYQGRNESFWEHQGKAVVVWGYQAPEMQCEVRAERHPQ